MTSIVGREAEIEILEQSLHSKTSEFIAIYGRRRVGKTHLIREFFQPKSRIYFSVTGLKDGKLDDQLQNFQDQLEKVFFNNTRLPKISTWREAFKILGDVTRQSYEGNKTGQIVLFLDELPWMATPRSGLIQALDHAWNTEWVQIPVLRLVVCGSAASWMINQLILAKGGLHHRITRKILLSPFSLAETALFLQSLGIYINQSQILEIYMAIGGIAHYLKQVQKGQSATQAIAKICFSKNGYLRDEFNLLFQSLFNESDNHMKIINALASKKSGLTRKEIIAKTGISSGGRLANWLNELEHAGFIATLVPYGKTEKNIQYKIIDEYVWFYLKWIKKAPKSDDAESYWIQASKTPAYQAWAGFAFEAVCFKHTAQIKRALKIQSLTLQTNYWSYTPLKGEMNDQGAQIDILFDRTDGVITLGEIKYSSTEFALDKSYAQTLKYKIEIFGKKTQTKKQIFLALITTHGLKQSIWSEGLIHHVVTLDSLFKNE